MTSQLNVDTIVDKAGSGGTNIKIGNNATYIADGGSATQNTVQGLTKAWLKHDAGDSSVKDSFNHSSVNDLGSGRSDCNLTNSMLTANNSCTSANNTAIACISNQITMTTSRYSSDHFTTAGSFSGAAHCSTQMCGDLA